MKPYVRPESQKAKEYRTLRPWLQTVDKFKAIALYFNAPMTEVLDHIANEILKANGIIMSHDSDGKVIWKHQPEPVNEAGEGEPSWT